MRVLIAEDEALIRMDLREMLTEEGHEAPLLVDQLAKEAGVAAQLGVVGR